MLWRVRDLLSGMAAGLLLLAGAAGCGSAESVSPVSGADAGGSARDAAAPSADPAGKIRFTDRAREVGIDFEHFNGMSGEFYFSEMMGPGAALFDMDDGDLDAYLVQGQMLGAGPTLDDALTPLAPKQLAIDLATDAGRSDLAARMSDNLARYRRGEPCRTPWRDDAPEHRPGPAVEPGLLGAGPAS